MKSFYRLFISLALLSYGTAQAQNAPVATKKGQPEHDHMMMHDGNMMLVKNGVASP